MSDLQSMQCPGCGAAITSGRENCEYCGTKIQYPKEEVKIAQVVEQPTIIHYVEQPIKVCKDKTVAILLSIFFGFFAWIYTWEKDKWKFWVGLGGTIITIGYGYFAFWIWAIVDAAIRKQEFYNNYTK